MTPQQIISPIVTGATEMTAGLGEAAVGFFESLFLDTNGDISTFGVFLLVTVGIGVGIGIMRWIRAKLPG